MIQEENSEQQCWAACPHCQGQGTKTRRLTKKVRLQYQLALEAYEKSDQQGAVPIRPKANSYLCPSCGGIGILPAASFPPVDVAHFPHVAIIGAGIAGVALAVACRHRGIPYTLYERDASFDARAQGYGLTLQQASKAIRGFGIQQLALGINSTRHVVHTPEGKIVGEWGARKWLPEGIASSAKRSNIHIARQSLRKALLEQLDTENAIAWNHQLIGIQQHHNKPSVLSFQVDGQEKQVEADLIVGTDGIRSMVRSHMLDDSLAPLNYLDCMVILGICPLAAITDRSSPLLDSATVFQTANGHERIYMMPFDSEHIMWQLSFPMEEEQAKHLNQEGQQALKTEAISRTKWHSPIPAIMEATPAELITGYPVYDRKLMQAEWLQDAGAITIIGDAAHPMSPFKGQGANQALLDALSLAKQISRKCDAFSQWKEKGLRATLLNDFEADMLTRSAVKVKDSAEAAQFLHSELALEEQDSPRSSCAKRAKI